jgi:hypothetical protein
MPIEDKLEEINLLALKSMKYLNIQPLMTTSIMLCALRHTMQVGEMGRRREYCNLCEDTSDEKAAVAMHCPECCKSICEKCLPVYHDIGFAMFLSSEDRGSLFEYKEKPGFATTPYRSPWAMPVYNLYQEFKDTAEHRETLKKQIKQAEKKVCELKDKLAASEERALGK